MAERPVVLPPDTESTMPHRSKPTIADGQKRSFECERPAETPVAPKSKGVPRDLLYPETQRSEFCHKQAERLKRLADGCDDPQAKAQITQMAQDWLSAARNKLAAQD